MPAGLVLGHAWCVWVIIPATLVAHSLLKNSILAVSRPQASLTSLSVFKLQISLSFFEISNIGEPPWTGKGAATCKTVKVLPTFVLALLVRGALESHG